MITLIPDRYVPEEVTTEDLIIASVAWGFTLGIGWLATWTATKQTASVVRRRGRQTWRNAYVVMIWGEILACLVFGVLCYLYLLGVIAPSFAFYFGILTSWVIQVQFLLQIIINRCGILMANQAKVWRLKWGVAGVILLVNISVYCIWIPARLQISDRFVHINEIWDRCEKVIYLVVDGCLNFLFIRIVKRNLVDNGLQKYNNLVRFNIFIIGFSLSMDVLIIAMMSLKNTFVYMQFHPLAYIVKLNIEMSMATLIAKIAKSSGKNTAVNKQLSSGSGAPKSRDTCSSLAAITEENWATVTKTIELTHVDAAPSASDLHPGITRTNTETALACRDRSYSVHIEANPR